MPYFTYDTSVLISRNALDLLGRRSELLLSSVALMEMSASAADDTQRKHYEFLYRQYLADKTLIVPDDTDWLFASKILFWLARRRRRVEGGRLSRLQPGASQRMAMDVLLAASARRCQATIVTENWKDFKLIQHFCHVKLIKASDFFR